MDHKQLKTENSTEKQPEIIFNENKDPDSDEGLGSESELTEPNQELSETEVQGTKPTENPGLSVCEVQNPEISNSIDQNLDISEQPEFENPDVEEQNPDIEAPNLELSSTETENPDFSDFDHQNPDLLEPKSAELQDSQNSKIQTQNPELSDTVIQSPDFSNSEQEILDLLKSDPTPDSSEVEVQISELLNQSSEPSNIQETELSEVENSQTEYLVNSEHQMLTLLESNQNTDSSEFQNSEPVSQNPEPSNIQETKVSEVENSGSEYLVNSEEAVIVIDSDTKIDEEVIALVQASVELISQQEEFNLPKPSDQPLSEPENFEYYESLNQEIPTSMAQVEVEVEPEFKPSKDGSTIFLIHGVDSTIDYCPACKTKLCPFRGGYSVNCVNFDVTLQCYECGKTIVIKKSFSLHQKNVLWMNSV